MFGELDERDKTPEVRRVQQQILRELTIEDRIKVVFALTKMKMGCTRAHIRECHPDHTDEQVEYSLRRIMWGDKLFREVYPDVEVAP